MGDQGKRYIGSKCVSLKMLGKPVKLYQRSISNCSFRRLHSRTIAQLRSNYATFLSAMFLLFLTHQNTVNNIFKHVETDFDVKQIKFHQLNGSTRNARVRAKKSNFGV